MQETVPNRIAISEVSLARRRSFLRFIGRFLISSCMKSTMPSVSASVFFMRFSGSCSSFSSAGISLFFSSI